MHQRQRLGRKGASRHSQANQPPIMCIYSDPHLSPDPERESCGLPSNGYTALESGTAARTENPNYGLESASLFRPGWLNEWHTGSPVQNIGQFSHGGSLACPNQVLKYGFRTNKGITGGVKVEASMSTAAVAARAMDHLMVQEYRISIWSSMPDRLLVTDQQSLKGKARYACNTILIEQVNRSTALQSSEDGRGRKWIMELPCCFVPCCRSDEGSAVPQLNVGYICAHA